MKPKKIPYKDQGDVWKRAEIHLKNILLNSESVREAFVWASLAEGQFGLYKKEYKGKMGSDIDLVIVMSEPIDIPGDWKDTKFETTWFRQYFLGYFEYKGNQHQIDGLIVIPSKHDINRMKEQLKGRSKKII